MTDCKFKVGEIYKGRNGVDYRVVAIVPDAVAYCQLVTLRLDSNTVGVRYIDGKVRPGDLCEPADLTPNKRKEWVVTYVYGGRDYVEAHDTEDGADYAVANLEKRNARAVEYGNPPPYTEIRGPFLWESED